MNKCVKTKELFRAVPAYLSPLFDSCEYPWEMLSGIRNFLLSLLEKGMSGYTLLSPGVLVGEGVRISPTATVEGPALIGAGTEIRPGAFLRGSVIAGEGCVIGNSSELKNCILLDGVQAPHYNYVGDSVLGHRVHVGAGTVCSNLKTDGRAVVVHGEREYPTGLRKVGAMLGDGADVGCHCVLNPGTVVGQGTAVYPMTRLRGVYPAHSIVKSETLWVPKEER